jgi:hypothetical protein
MMKGDDSMSFILGFLIGLITAIGGVGFLGYWLVSRSGNVAVAKFIAQALAHKPKSEPVEPGENGEATEEAGERAKKRQGRDRP